MPAFQLQFTCSVRNESAKAAMESYGRILQQAFDHYRNLWEEYAKLQEKYDQRNAHSSPQVEANASECTETKELTPQRDINSRSTLAAGSNSIPLLQLDTLSMSYSDFNSDTFTSSPESNEFRLGDGNDSLSRSPVLSKSRLKINSTSAKRVLHLSKAAEDNKTTSDSNMHHNGETIFSKGNKKEISTSQHVETTFLPDGKRLKQSRLAFQPVKRTEASSSNVKLLDTPLHAKLASGKNISTVKATVALKDNVPIADETLEDVIEVSPTQRDVQSKVKHRLKLKRKTPMKRAKRKSPDKNGSHNIAPMITIEDVDFETPFEQIPVAVENDGSVTPNPTATDTVKINKVSASKARENDGAVTSNSTTMNAVKNKVNASKSSPVKMFNETAKPVERKQQPSAAQNIMLDVNDPAYEEETFYLPAEQAANRRSANDYSLNDTENQPPAKKMLLEKSNAVSTRKDVPEQLNTRTRTDRAKLNGWDCWECKQYYENLPLSKEELQKRKNQCSRHRYKYERPRTPEGFWDLDFPDTMSNTYRQD